MSCDLGAATPAVATLLLHFTSRHLIPGADGEASEIQSDLLLWATESFHPQGRGKKNPQHMCLRKQKCVASDFLEGRGESEAVWNVLSHGDNKANDVQLQQLELKYLKHAVRLVALTAEPSLHNSTGSLKEQTLDKKGC